MGDVFTGHIVIRACSARSSLRKLNDDLDVIRLSLKGLRECFQWFKASDEAREPPTVCACKYFSRLVPMPLVGVDAVDHHAVLEHSRARDISRRGAKCGPAACSSGRTCFARLKAAQLALSVRKMNLDARYGSVTATFVLALVAFCTSLDALAAEPQRVLLLHSFGREFAPYDAVVAAFRTELAQGASAPIAVYDESLDAEQAFGSDDQELILELSTPPLRRLAAGCRGHDWASGCRLLSAGSGQAVPRERGWSLPHWTSGLSASPHCALETRSSPFTRTCPDWLTTFCGCCPTRKQLQ